jgi:hypothetical protein
MKLVGYTVLFFIGGISSAPDNDISGARSGDHEHDRQAVLDMGRNLSPRYMFGAVIEREDFDGKEHQHDHEKQDQELNDLVFFHIRTRIAILIEL